MIGGLVAAGALMAIMIGTWPAFESIGRNMSALQGQDAEIVSKKSQLAAKEQEYQQTEANRYLPSDLKIRTYKPDTLEKNIKEMLDTIIQLAVQSNNVLISLEPTKKEGVIQDETNNGVVPLSKAVTVPTEQTAAPTPDPNNPAGTPPTDPNAAATGAPAIDPTTGLPLDPNAAPAVQQVQPNEINTYAYTLSLRGTFDTLKDFISSLSENPEIVEITSIEMKNEVGPDRVKDDMGATSQEQDRSDPARPIKLVVNMKLYLLPDTGISPPTPDPAAAATNPADPNAAPAPAMPSSP
jgi:hypothetical protein